MKKWILLFVVIGVVFLAGCIEPTAKVGCCAKDNVTAGDGCVLLNMTTSELEDYTGETAWCNETTNVCNVSIGGKYYLVPVCTDSELNECIDPNCTAMVCGDFMFKPKIAPGVVASENSEGAEVAPPPEQEEEEGRLNFYKAQCKFMKMDNKLASLMKNTDSEINVFRFGIGESFDEFERYKYFFPMTDKYCNVYPEIYGFTGERVDRYMNYLSVQGSSTHVPYDPEDIPVDCMNDIAGHHYDVDIFKYGRVDYPDYSDCEIPLSQIDYSEYSYERFCTHVDPIDEDMTSYYLGQTLRLDKSFYRKGLSIAHAETIYDETTSRAPFECLFGTDCYSGTCNTDYYSRSVSVVEGGLEVTTDCHVAEDSYDQPIVACSAATDVTIDTDAEDPPDFDYAEVPVRLAKINVRADSYPGSSFSHEPDPPEDFSIDNCEKHDNVCELVQQWRDFSGLDLGQEVDGKSGGYLAYDLGEQVISDGFELSTLPIDFGFEDSDSCDLLGGADTSECPYITYEDAYPPAGGVVFFGHDSSNPIIWEEGGTEYEIIGYAIAPHSPDFHDYFFIERCSREYSFGLPETVGEGAEAYICSASCMDRCSGSGIDSDVLFDECHDYCYDVGDFPCDVTGTITESLPFSEDLIPVEVGRPDGENWQKLMDTFEPLFMERIERLQKLNWEDDCGGRMDAPDVILSTIPWVLEFKKRGKTPAFTSSEAARVLYDYNIYNEHASGRISNLCYLRYDGKHDDDDDYDYWMLYADEIWLIKKPLDNTLGSCEVDSQGFPSMNTYGWCEPCTGSTIAYQEIVSTEVYVPDFEVRIPHEYSGTGSGLSVLHQQLCSLDGDDMNCDMAWWITDVEELNGVPEDDGSPSINPVATTLKERIGDYLKSGVLPVLDMTHDSNWDVPVEQDCEGTWLESEFGIGRTFELDCYDVPIYSEYGFEDIYGDMGAVVTIVDTIDMDSGSVSSLSGSAARDRIAERTGVIKMNCPRCIPAIQVYNIPDNDTLDELLSALFSDSRLRLDIDVVGFWYRPIGYEYEAMYEGDDLDEKAESTVDHMLSFSRTILGYGKASIITKFAVYDTGDTWNDESSGVLFDEIADRSGEFSNSGTIGIIYGPARTTFSYSSSGALVDASGIQGMKGEKFCNLQLSINRYLTPPPTTIFSGLPSFESVNCTNCTAVDYLTGTCSPVCANGELCEMPSGVTTGMKCPAGAIAEPCRLCNETPGTYRCEYTYANRSTEVREYDSSLISSDAYMDVIGGLEEPNKCCIVSDGGEAYSYSKQSISTTRNIPVVYPKSGNTNIDCGAIGYSGGVFTGAYCGIEVVPVRDYEVTCEFIPD